MNNHVLKFLIFSLSILYSLTILHGETQKVVTYDNLTKILIETLDNNITQYTINRDIDLKYDTLYLPEKAILNIDGGKLYNGCISGKNVYLIGDLEQCFSNISFSGSLQNKTIDYSWFDQSENDNSLLYSMFSFLFNDSECETTLIMEPNKIYNVDGPKLDYGHSLFEFYQFSNKKIIGNNSTINDLRNRKLISYTSYDGVMLFNNCSNITIERLNYSNLNEDYVEISNGDKVLYERGFENQVGYVGTSFILLQNDCSNINIDSDVIGARYGVKSGDYSKHWLCGDFGLKNSSLKIKALNTGYPVAIEVGDSLEISINSQKHHRAAYLCGISNSKIKIKAQDIYIAPYHCLLSDSRFSHQRDSIPHFKACSNLNVSVKDTGTKTATNKDSFCVGFQTYNTFKERGNIEYWHDISINVEKEKYAPAIGLFAFSRMNNKDEYSPLDIMDVFENIWIVGYDVHKSDQYSFRIRLGNSIVLRNFSFAIDSPYSDCIIENHTDYQFNLAESKIRQVNIVSTRQF